MSLAQLLGLRRGCTSCQPEKHAKQPLEKQNSPLSRVCGKSMIYLGRNLPSVSISLIETVTKIVTGRLKINQLSRVVTVRSFSLILNAGSYPNIRVSASLVHPAADHGDVSPGAEMGIAVG